MRNAGSLILSGFFIVLFSFMIFEMQEYPDAAAMVPKAVAVPGLLLATAQFLLDLWHVLKGDGKEPEEPAVAEPVAGRRSGLSAFLTETRKKEFAMVGWILVIVSIVLSVGLWVAIAVFPPLFMRFYGKETWKLSLTVGAGGWASFYLVFDVLLRVQLFQGLIFESM